MGKTDVVVEELEAKIVSGEYKSGVQLRDTSISFRLALERLKERHLVDVFPKRGTFIRTVEIEEVVELTKARAAIEEAVVARLVDQPTDLAPARKINDNMRELVEAWNAATSEPNEQVQKFASLDLDFHIQLARLGGFDTTFARWLRDIRWRFLLFARPTVESFKSDTIGEHDRMLDAIESGDLEKAKSRLEDHLTRAFARWAITSCHPQIAEFARLLWKNPHEPPGKRPRNLK